MRVSYEEKRGCGWRKGGGIYLVAEGDPHPCCKLPIELTVCPTCHHGIHPARGWTWIEIDPFLKSFCTQDERRCFLNREKVGKVGLIWVGEKYYKTTVDYVREAVDMGISRRITAVPKGFKIGETIVCLAHRKAVFKGFQGDSQDAKDESLFAPGIFYCFMPTALEYVVKGDETEEELEAIKKRGLEPVKVIPVTKDDRQKVMGE